MGKGGLPGSGQGAGKQKRLTLMPLRPCPRTQWSACLSTTSQPGATTRPSRRPVIGVCPARSPRTRPRTVSARSCPTHLHPGEWTAVSGSGHCGDPPHSQPPRCRRLSLLTSFCLFGNHCSDQSVVAPKCQSLSPWRLLGGLPGSSLCGQCLRIGGCLHPDGVFQRYVSMAVFLSEPRAATSLPGALGPPHCPPPPWPSKWTPLLALLSWPMPVPWHWSGVSVGKGPGACHIWCSGRGFSPGAHP